MTANTLLNNYLDALKMSDGRPLDLQKVILDILKYLTKKENKQYQNNQLWADISRASVQFDSGYPEISLPNLRKILEKYKILRDEKNGM